ncbi:hypothetical protein AABB24_022550 [Solanum stoloniferum]|uniref:DUF3444 domain-containing protein n=1 Tax=Solanum stoloniferum TaxID=62892 RepID=A0ABD2T0X7_9SOLN
MPRHYALIRKVLYPGFKIKFRLFVPYPEDQREGTRVGGCLPISCGKFRCGVTAYTYNLFAFSHQVQCIKAERGQYIVFPRKGEIWALFKDRDINRSSSPKNQREFKYKVVEILSEYLKNVGVEVRSLDKVIRFVSLFQRARLTAVGTFFIKPNELHKFTHRIPSFKMTGTEPEGVPTGSFELDPYALPLNPDDSWYPGKVKECMQ